MFPREILMIVFGPPEAPALDLVAIGALKACDCIKPGDERLGRAVWLAFWGKTPSGSWALVWSLAVHLSRIVGDREEYLKQLGVADLRGIEAYPHGLGMAGALRNDALEAAVCRRHSRRRRR